MQLLILAGGYGTRLKSVLEDNTPKPMAPVGETVFLEYQLINWKTQGVKKFIFLLHYNSDVIIKFVERIKNTVLKNCSIYYIVEEIPLDTGGAILNAIKILNISTDFFVTNGDTWLKSGVEQMLNSKSPSIGVIKVNDTSRYGIVEFNDARIVSRFLEKKNQGEGWINAGILHLSPEYFDLTNVSKFSLERDLLPKLVEKKCLKAIKLNTTFIDIGVPLDYFHFCELAGNKKL
jgi:D-glycero-alpha-D-manno-heptose 1-phosphate guanylyltransferase